jgi:electron transfer flavoprotein alpha subunit
MPVLIFIDQSEGHIKKSSFEALSYGAKVAEQIGTTAEGIVLEN